MIDIHGGLLLFAPVNPITKLLFEAKVIRQRPFLQQEDRRRLAEIKAELGKLCPSLMKFWQDAESSVDPWAELEKLRRWENEVYCSMGGR
jgi:hypothetical protein